MVKGAEKMKAELMEKNERSDGPFFKIRNDPRITKAGKILRRTRLDEFPQFFNVLMGELSLVGPRPHEPEELNAYPPELKEICLAKSGLTGLSQISGNSKLPFLQELELDRQYLKDQSIFLDLEIITKTIWILVCHPDGI
jgi:lipopolysaccharide/colanic/teichoic acid biosynthesis glycosyltransferase